MSSLIDFPYRCTQHTVYSHIQPPRKSSLCTLQDKKATRNLYDSYWFKTRRTFLIINYAYKRLSEVRQDIMITQF